MIKINLLPERKVKKERKKVEIKLSGEIGKKLAIPIVITLVILLAIFAYCESTKSSLEKQIDEQKKKLELLQKKNTRS